MINKIKFLIIIIKYELRGLISLGVICSLFLPISGLAQTSSTVSAPQQPDKQMAAIKEFLDSLGEMQFSPNAARFSARWYQPIRIYVDLPYDPELQKQLTDQFYRLKDEVPGLPALTVQPKIDMPEKANFVIESASEKDIQQKAAAREIKIDSDQCAMSINVEPRGVSSTQINRTSLITRESLSRETSRRCLLKLIMMGLGIADADGNSILLFNAVFNANNKAEDGYGIGDIALLRYAYAEKSASNPKTMSPDETLALSFLGAPHMAQRALSNYQDVKALIQKLYASPESRKESFQKLAALLGKPSALAYLSLMPMSGDKDFEIFQEVVPGVDATDFDLLLRQCSGCFFMLLANSVESVFAHGRHSDAKKFISTMIAADKPGNSQIQRFLVLYYQSLLEWESPDSEKKLNEAIDLVKTSQGIRSQTFMNFKGTLARWYAQHGDMAKAVMQLDDTENLYDTTILPPLNEGRQLMSRAEIYRKADNKTKARQSLARARKLIENAGTDADLVRLESIEKNFAAD